VEEIEEEVDELEEEMPDATDPQYETWMKEHGYEIPETE